jgi:hypothetical protein
VRIGIINLCGASRPDHDNSQASRARVMNDWIVPLSVMRRSDVVQVGGKAAALGELLSAGFPVPPGLCVTTAVFHQAIGPYREEIARLCQQVDVLEPRTAVAASEKIFISCADGASVSWYFRFG